MRVALLSDIHVEFMRDYGKSFAESLDPSDVDVLVLAGDIGTVTGKSLITFLDLICVKYPHVVYVLGNHEAYSSNRTDVINSLTSFSKKHANFHWLENSAVEINGQRFIGSTLWFSEAPDGKNKKYEHTLNDFWMIKKFKDWVYSLNTQSIEYLKSNLCANDIVVTHHLPSYKCVHKLYKNSPLNRFFVCDVEALILERQPKYWLFGHTHSSVDLTIGKCHCVCNPFGYVNDLNPQFNEKLIIEV